MHFLRWNCLNFAEDFTEFIPSARINNTPVLVQIMAWRRPGDKPLSEAMMVRLPTHIYASLSLNELNRARASATSDLLRLNGLHAMQTSQYQTLRCCCGEMMHWAYTWLIWLRYPHGGCHSDSVKSAEDNKVVSWATCVFQRLGNHGQHFFVCAAKL